MTRPTDNGSVLSKEIELLRELARVKVLFQARSIAAVMGVPASSVTVARLARRDMWSPEAWAEIEAVQTEGRALANPFQNGE